MRVSRALPLAMLSAVIVLQSGAGSAELPTGPLPACPIAQACPDLVTDPNTFSPRLVTQFFGPNNCDVLEGMVQQGTRNLLRFTFTSPNLGSMDLVVGPPAARPDLFEFSSCHGHYHFREYADYRLWTPDQFSAWEALRIASPDLTPAQVLAAHPELAPVAGGKRGFCVIDLVRYQGHPLGIRKYNSCDFQGISIGWADEYHWTLPGQYVDITGLAAGDYVLEAEINAERLFAERTYANNRASRNVTI